MYVYVCTFIINDDVFSVEISTIDFLTLLSTRFSGAKSLSYMFDIFVSFYFLIYFLFTSIPGSCV